MNINFQFWEGRLVGPEAYLPTAVRTPGNPGPQIQPGDLVLLNLSGPFSLALPDPRPCPGKMIAIAAVGLSTVTLNAYPGTTVVGGSSWAVPIGDHGSCILVSTGEVTKEWRVIARFEGL